MDVGALEALALVLAGGIAGWLGALVGIGGGVFIVPVLVLIFGLDFRVAVATSLVTVVATSTAAGSVYVGSGLTNMRLGMTLEVATTLGGISGGLLAAKVPHAGLSGLFGVLMIITAVLMLRGGEHGSTEEEDRQTKERRPESEARNWSEREDASPPRILGHEAHGAIAGSYYDTAARTVVPYAAERIFLGSSISFLAGLVSGMLGVGGGFLKVPAMNLGMRIPLKVAAATSNFMVGVTAIASFFIYFARGNVHPYVASATTLGVVVGALAGTSFAARTRPDVIRKVLSVVVLLVAVQMLLEAFGVEV